MSQLPQLDWEKIEGGYEDIKRRAKNVLEVAKPYAEKSSGVYDVSKNKIIVAGIPLDGVVEAKLSESVLTRHENGIDHRYVAIYKSIEQKTFSVSLLPTARCLDLLYQLGDSQQLYSGWFNISIHENGRLVDVYRAWINTLPEVSMRAETDNKVVTFGVKTMLDSVARVDTPTEFETDTYKRYGKTREVDRSKVLVKDDKGFTTDAEGNVYFPNYGEGKEGG